MPFGKLRLEIRQQIETEVPKHIPLKRLGSEDDVTPFAGGLALADKWGLPQENRLVSRRGHFSAGLAVGAENAPLQRLLDLLG